MRKMKNARPHTVLVILLFLILTASAASAACSTTTKSCSTCGSGNTVAACTSGTCASGACVPNFTASGSNRKVNFKNASTGKYSACYWNFGDGSISRDCNPYHVYTKPGRYHVYLSIKCGNTCDSWIGIGKVIDVK